MILLSTILNFYDNGFGCEDFLRIIDWMPYIIELDFEGDKLVGTQEHCHVEKDETFYQEYKDILIKVIDNEKLPIVYNVNFGHTTPRCALQYGAVAKVDMKQKKIFVNK